MERSFPKNLKYTAEHEWCEIGSNKQATIGITWHAQDALGDIVFCDLPKVGETLEQGKTLGVVESVKAVSDLYAPLSGKVIERNEAVIAEPQKLNEDCYGAGWLLKIEISQESEVEKLLSVSDYEKLLQAE